MRVIENFTLVVLMRNVNLTHLRVLKVSGDDAESFLQGQLSNDIAQLDQSWQYSAYCTPKGRALAVFMVWKHQKDIFMMTEASVLESTIKRLRMYVMRSKVVIEEVAAAIVGKIAPPSDSVDNKETTELAEARYTCDLKKTQHTLFFGGRLIEIDFETSRFEIDDAEPENAWHKIDISEALPRVTQVNSDQFVPQMLNLDVLNGISFKKGCYTGQEIIARMRYLGKLKQRMQLCQLVSDQRAPDIGDKIIDANGKTLGCVVNSLPEFNRFTASLREDSAGEGLFSDDGEPLAELIDLPYPLPMAKQG